MTTALEGVKGSASRPGRFLPPGKIRYPWYRRLGGPQGRSGQVRKISPPTGIRTPDRPARIQSLYRLSYPDRQRTYYWMLWSVRWMFLPPQLFWQHDTISLEEIAVWWLWIVSTDFLASLQISNFTAIGSVGSSWYVQTDGQTEMPKLISAFLCFVHRAS